MAASLPPPPPYYSPPMPPPTYRPVTGDKGKIIGYGLLIAGGAVAIGLTAWGVYQLLLGGPASGPPNNPTGCNAATAAYQNYEAEITAIITANPTGLNGSVASEITTLSGLAATQMGYIGQYCTPTCAGVVGCSIADVEAWMGKYGSYLGWLVVGVVGFSAYQFLSKRWGPKPSSPKNANPPSNFNPATVGQTAANAKTIDAVEKGTMTPSEGTDAINAWKDTFPPALVAGTWYDTFQAQAASIANTEVVVSDALVTYAEAVLVTDVVAAAVALDAELALLAMAAL